MEIACLLSIIGQMFIIGGLVGFIAAILEESDKWWVAIIVVLMGVVMNFVFGFWAIFVVSPPA